jgi:hypothetical protein
MNLELTKEELKALGDLLSDYVGTYLAEGLEENPDADTTEILDEISEIDSVRSKLVNP